MRIWDEMLLHGTSSVVKHDQLTVDTDYTISGTIYADFFQQYESLGVNLFLFAKATGNSYTGTNAMECAYVSKNAAYTDRAFKNKGDIIAVNSSKSSQLSAGSTLDVYYVAFDTASAVYGKRGIESVSMTVPTNYTDSYAIYNAFLSPYVQSLLSSNHRISAVLLPDNPRSARKYMQCMTESNLRNAIRRVLIYPSTSTAPAGGIDAYLNAGDTLKLLIFDYTELEGI